MGLWWGYSGVTLGSEWGYSGVLGLRLTLGISVVHALASYHPLSAHDGLLGIIIQNQMNVFIGYNLVVILYEIKMQD